jgi:large subunit ribosomal protein L10
MPSQDKKEKVKQIKKWFDKSDSLLVLHYKGVSVSEANELRGTLSGMDCELRVVKNTLTRIALADSPKESVTPLIDGPVAVVFVHNDPAGVAKTIRDFGKGRKEFFMLGGWLEGTVLDSKQVDSFALLPSREVLLAQLVGVVQAPLSRLIGTVVAPARKMLGLFKALETQVTEKAAQPAVTEKPAQPPAESAAEQASEEQPDKATIEEVANKEATTEEVAVTEQAAAPPVEEPSEEASEESTGDTPAQ